MSVPHSSTPPLSPLPLSTHASAPYPTVTSISPQILLNHESVDDIPQTLVPHAAPSTRSFDVSPFTAPITTTLSPPSLITMSSDQLEPVPLSLRPSPPMPSNTDPSIISDGDLPASPRSRPLSQNSLHTTHHASSHSHVLTPSSSHHHHLPHRPRVQFLGLDQHAETVEVQTRVFRSEDDPFTPFVVTKEQASAISSRKPRTKDGKRRAGFLNLDGLQVHPPSLRYRAPRNSSTLYGPDSVSGTNAYNYDSFLDSNTKARVMFFKKRQKLIDRYQNNSSEPQKQFNPEDYPDLVAALARLDEQHEQDEHLRKLREKQEQEKRAAQLAAARGESFRLVASPSQYETDTASHGNEDGSTGVTSTAVSSPDAIQNVGHRHELHLSPSAPPITSGMRFLGPYYSSLFREVSDLINFDLGKESQALHVAGCVTPAAVSSPKTPPLTPLPRQNDQIITDRAAYSLATINQNAKTADDVYNGVLSHIRLHAEHPMLLHGVLRQRILQEEYNAIRAKLVGATLARAIALSIFCRPQQITIAGDDFDPVLKWFWVDTEGSTMHWSSSEPKLDDKPGLLRRLFTSTPETQEILRVERVTLGPFARAGSRAKKAKFKAWNCITITFNNAPPKSESRREHGEHKKHTTNNTDSSDTDNIQPLIPIDPIEIICIDDEQTRRIFMGLQALCPLAPTTSTYGEFLWTRSSLKMRRLAFDKVMLKHEYSLSLWEKACDFKYQRFKRAFFLQQKINALRWVIAQITILCGSQGYLEILNGFMNLSQSDSGLFSRNQQGFVEVNWSRVHGLLALVHEHPSLRTDSARLNQQQQDTTSSSSLDQQDKPVDPAELATIRCFLHAKRRLSAYLELCYQLFFPLRTSLNLKEIIEARLFLKAFVRQRFIDAAAASSSPPFAAHKDTNNTPPTITSSEPPPSHTSDAQFFQNNPPDVFLPFNDQTAPTGTFFNEEFLEIMKAGAYESSRHVHLFDQKRVDEYDTQLAAEAQKANSILEDTTAVSLEEIENRAKLLHQRAKVYESELVDSPDLLLHEDSTIHNNLNTSDCIAELHLVSSHPDQEVTVDDDGAADECTESHPDGEDKSPSSPHRTTEAQNSFASTSASQDDTYHRFRDHKLFKLEPSMIGMLEQTPIAMLADLQTQLSDMLYLTPELIQIVQTLIACQEAQDMQQAPPVSIPTLGQNTKVVQISDTLSTTSSTTIASSVQPFSLRPSAITTSTSASIDPQTSIPIEALVETFGTRSRRAATVTPHNHTSLSPSHNQTSLSPPHNHIQPTGNSVLTPQSAHANETATHVSQNRQRVIRNLSRFISELQKQLSAEVEQFITSSGTIQPIPAPAVPSSTRGAASVTNSKAPSVNLSDDLQFDAIRPLLTGCRELHLPESSHFSSHNAASAVRSVMGEHTTGQTSLPRNSGAQSRGKQSVTAASNSGPVLTDLPSTSPPSTVPSGHNTTHESLSIVSDNVLLPDASLMATHTTCREHDLNTVDFLQHVYRLQTEQLKQHDLDYQAAHHGHHRHLTPEEQNVESKIMEFVAYLRAAMYPHLTGFERELLHEGFDVRLIMKELLQLAPGCTSQAELSEISFKPRQ